MSGFGNYENTLESLHRKVIKLQEVFIKNRPKSSFNSLDGLREAE